MNSEQKKQCWKDIGIDGDSSCEKLRDLIHCRNCSEYCSAGRELFDRKIPEAYIAEWTEFFAEEYQETRQTGLLVMVFRLHQEWLALPVNLLKQVAASQKTHRIPHARGIVAGLVNIDGKLQLCVALARLLQIESSQENSALPKQSRLILIEREKESWAFQVDEILGEYRLGVDELREVPVTLAKSPTRHTKGVFNCEEKVVSLLDEELLFSGLQRSVS